MTDDLVRRLRVRAEFTGPYSALWDEAANYIEDLEKITKDDARWLAAYHKWCAMNGCAPSSSDLIVARKKLEGKDG